VMAFRMRRSNAGQKCIQVELARLGFQVSARTWLYTSVSQPGPNRDVGRVSGGACIGNLGLRLFLRPVLRDNLRVLHIAAFENAPQPG
jgi:hypothetical protein